MKYSEAVAWLDAMYQAALNAQGVIIEGYRDRVSGGKKLRGLDGDIIRSISGWVFNGEPDKDTNDIGLGKGIVGGLERVHNRIKEGGTMTPMELYNFLVIFQHDSALGVCLVELVSRRQLTVDGVRQHLPIDPDIRILAGWTTE
jgi:hypothetical protein